MRRERVGEGRGAGLRREGRVGGEEVVGGTEGGEKEEG